MNTDLLSRHTFVLDRSVGDDLVYLSARMGVSRSALVRELLTPALSDLARLLRSLPDSPSPADVEHFRKDGLTLMADAYMAGLAELGSVRHD